MTDIQRTSENDPDGDLVLAYLRGELSTAEQAAFELRLRNEPALQQELKLLQTAAELVTDEFVDQTSDQAYARIAARLGLPAAPGLAPSSAAATPNERERPAAPWFERLKSWWNGHAGVLQPALIALVLLQSGVIAHYMGAADTSAPNRVESAAPMRGAPASCNDALLTPKPGIGLEALLNWVLQYGGSIVAGPDTQGRLRIGFPDATAYQSFVHDPAAARLARQLDPAAACGNRP